MTRRRRFAAHPYLYYIRLIQLRRRPRPTLRTRRTNR